MQRTNAPPGAFFLVSSLARSGTHKSQTAKFCQFAAEKCQQNAGFDIADITKVGENVLARGLHIGKGGTKAGRNLKPPKGEVK
jgi:hypothetical protein